MTKSTGKNVRRGTLALSVIGKQFGRLTVIAVATPHGSIARVLCHCDCGNDKVVHVWNLKRGKHRSCGCRQQRTIHGECDTPEYSTWEAMKQRCYKPHWRRFDLYGGRGIKVCQRWRDSYAAFLQDMGRKPSPKLSLDRINGDGDYEPTNCRWASAQQQVTNRRKRIPSR